MNKGLEALKRIRQETCPATYIPDFDKEECCKIIEKELKALEIIKKHPMFYLHDDLPQGTYRMYDCELYSHYDLTKEEYHLLKEVLL